MRLLSCSVSRRRFICVRRLEHIDGRLIAMLKIKAEFLAEVHSGAVFLKKAKLSICGNYPRPLCPIVLKTSTASMASPYRVTINP